jgi:hypothetical protein
MMKEKPVNLNGSSVSYTKKGLGARILGTFVQNTFIARLNSWTMLTLWVPFTDSAGNVVDTKKAEILQTPGGSTITLPPIPLQGGGSGGGGGTSLQWLHVKQDLGSSLQCVSWDGTTEGTTAIYVAKRPEMRINIGSQTIRGTVYNYSYASAAGSGGINFWTRTTTGGASTTEIATPDYLANQEIYAIGIPSITLDGHACVLMDTSGREWATQ